MNVLAVVHLNDPYEDYCRSPPFRPRKASSSLELSAEDNAIVIEQGLGFNYQETTAFCPAKIRLTQLEQLSPDDRFAGLLDIGRCRGGAARMPHCNSRNHADQQKTEERDCPFALSHHHNTHGASPGKQSDIQGGKE